MYNINKDYFKTWSSNMSYIYGLWFSCGYIYNNKFDMTLRKKDKYILKKVADELGYKEKLYDGVNKQLVRINFSCSVIYNDIVALGGNDILFPNIPKDFLPDFIRGYFDGKGNFLNVKGHRINSKIDGDKTFLIGLWKILKDNQIIEKGNYDSKNNCLKFGKKDTLSLAKYMYQNDPVLFLIRKKNIYKEDIS